MTKFAMVFPGQGSQSLGMLADAADNKIVQAVFQEASEVLGFDVWQLSQTGPEEKLNQTANTQPAILTASYALWQLWQAEGGAQPDYFAGHSLGEYTALLAAGFLSFKDAVNVVHQRGQFMQQAVPVGTGAMAAVLGLDNEVIAQCCGATNGVVSSANFNAIGQTVIAGAKTAVEAAAELCREAGAKKVVMLPVSVPSHCQLMQPAAEKMSVLLNSIELGDAKIPVLNNIHGKVETSAIAIKAALIAQLTQPVQWVKTIQQLAQFDVNTVLECGPGKVLTAMNKRIEKSLTYKTVNSIESLQAVVGE